MTKAVARASSTQLDLYDPARGLKEIAVSEAAERHFARAKDRTKLFQAIEQKLKAIREFVLWWDAQDKAKGARGIGKKVPSQNGDGTLTAGRDGSFRSGRPAARPLAQAHEG